MNKQSPLISFFYAVLAYGCWGFFPLYWKQLDAVGSHELIIWRIIITFLTLWLLMLLSGKQMIKDYFQTLFSIKKIKILATTGFLIVSNWGIYIWAVNNGHIVDASMGYFMTPILNIALGRIILKERLKGSEIIALLLVSSGLLYMTLKAHVIPWISLSLALTFAIYGLLRKRLPVSALLGLGVEISYPMLPLMFFLGAFSPHIPFNQVFSSMSPYELFLISLSGFFTIFPLWAFNKAVKGLRLATIGFIQYISPTLQFLTGIFIFHEVFTKERVIAFILVWVALAIVSLDLIRSSQNKSD